ncbi:MAG: hypothetical protein WCS64_04205 [Dehalococcoidales bacterium]
MTRIYRTQPKPHRANVTQEDTFKPCPAEGIVTRGYQECRFDITLEGVDIQSLVLRLVFYNHRLDDWFTGAMYELNSPGRHSITTHIRGGTVFLLFHSFTGTSFNMSADYCLS